MLTTQSDIFRQRHEYDPYFTEWESKITYLSYSMFYNVCFGVCGSSWRQFFRLVLSLQRRSRSGSTTRTHCIHSGRLAELGQYGGMILIQTYGTIEQPHTPDIEGGFKSYDGPTLATSPYIYSTIYNVTWVNRIEKYLVSYTWHENSGIILYFLYHTTA